MHFLSTSTLLLTPFPAPPSRYAILSHRWLSEPSGQTSEVSLQEYLANSSPSKPGHSKIHSACNFAAANGYEYIWIDNCCIDKTSSAELSEAINSMYTWYRRAAVCYVYLSDVPSDGKDPRHEGSAFRRSAWFTRGWTLQELLAPRNVIFLNAAWEDIGNKESLLPLLTEITGVNVLHFENPTEACVAVKLSWAARRTTFKEEDRAYCMLGLMGVNMPLLYGEGGNAFLPLQLEVLKISDDESIFAWEHPGLETFRGLLAPLPEAFLSAGNVRRRIFDPERPPFQMTNKGVQIELLVTHFWIKGEYYLIARNFYDNTPRTGNYLTYVAPLNCVRDRKEGKENGDEGPVVLHLFPDDNDYADMKRILYSKPEASRERIYWNKLMRKGVGVLEFPEWNLFLNKCFKESGECFKESWE